MTLRVSLGVPAPIRRGAAKPGQSVYVGIGLCLNAAGQVILSIHHDEGDALLAELDDAAFDTLCGLLVDLEPMRSVGNDR